MRYVVRMGVGAGGFSVFPHAAMMQTHPRLSQTGRTSTPFKNEARREIPPPEAGKQAEGAEMNSSIELTLESRVARQSRLSVAMKSMCWAALAVTAAAAVPARAEEPAKAPIKSAFGPGERSKFVVSYLGVPAGEFELSVGMLMKRDGREVWPVLSIAKTDIPIYTINDKYVAFWDPRAQEHVGTDFWIDENKKKRREHVYLRRNESKALVKRALQGEPLTDTTYDIDPTALDVSCAVMWLRNIPLELGKTYSRPVFTGAVAFTMSAEVLEKTKVQTKFGEKSAWKVAVFTQFAGQLAQKKNLTAYLAADNLQNILKVEAEFILGQINADLVEFEAGRDFTRG